MYYDRSYNEGYGAASNAAAASVQPLKFGGKEVERRGGLNWHDFKARWLSNGRFTTQDPKRETYYPLSPYAWSPAPPCATSTPQGDWLPMFNSSTKLVQNSTLAIRQ